MPTKEKASKGEFEPQKGTPIMVEREGETDIPSKRETPMSPEEKKSLEIAQQAIKGRFETQKGSPITVEREGETYVVTFIHIDPPGVRGPGYDARVIIDAKTWKVLRAFEGPN